MRGKTSVDLPQSIVAIAGPAVMRRIADHSRAHEIGFNVALAAQQIRFGLDEGGLVTTVPQGVGAAAGTLMYCT